ncbi:MAG: hypothetical protein LQ348_001931 [Seirophora lacunosa]|nr:MAG: hypothetical protein LQ348_001931 [Seirophora lacunosa]
MADIPLEELADAIRRRIIAGSFNIDVVNGHLHPVAELSLVRMSQHSTPARRTPAPTDSQQYIQTSHAPSRLRSHSRSRSFPRSPSHSNAYTQSRCRSRSRSQPQCRSRSSSQASDSSADLGTRLAAVISHARQHPAVHPPEHPIYPYPTPHNSTHASSPVAPSNLPSATTEVDVPEPTQPPANDTVYPASLSSHIDTTSSAARSRSSHIDTASSAARSSHAAPRPSRHAKVIANDNTTSSSRFKQTRDSTSKRRRLEDRKGPKEVGPKGAGLEDVMPKDAGGARDGAKDSGTGGAGTQDAGQQDAGSKTIAQGDESKLQQSRHPKDTLLPELHEVDSQTIAKRKFMAKWEKRVFNHAALDRLSRFVTVPHYVNRRPQEPFRELDKMMELISDFGSLDIQQGFAANLRLWISSDDRVLPSLEPPAHLKTLEPGKRETFQRLWRATHITEFRSGKADINGLLLRLSIVKEMTVYNETISFLKKNPDPHLNLRNGQSIAAKIREQIYETMYPHHLEATQKRSAFNRKQTLARPYMAMQKRYQNEGIFAMVPSSLSENAIAGTPRIEVLLEALELLRPDFHSDRLRFYSRIVNLLYTGNVPSDVDMQLLNRWSRVDCRALRLAAFKSNDASLIAHFDRYPVDGMYVSAEDRDNHSQMDVLDREESLAKRIVNQE